MGLTTSRLDLESFDSLPPHARRCVFWEVTTSSSHPPLPADETFADAGLSPPHPGALFESEFDKEAWISSVLLEWGTCGQLAIDAHTGVVVGTAFYAPPGRVPRSRQFPTSPVSADAILLTSIHAEPGYEQAAPLLLDAVVADLIRRGVRAIEAFGMVRGVSSIGPSRSGTTDLSTWSDEVIVEVAREILDGPGPDVCAPCMMDAEFLKDSAFDVVSSHPRFPRFRLELDEGLGWKSQVEGALEQLIVMATIELAGTERETAPVGRAHAERAPM